MWRRLNTVVRPPMIGRAAAGLRNRALSGKVEVNQFAISKSIAGVGSSGKRTRPSHVSPSLISRMNSVPCDEQPEGFVPRRLLLSQTQGKGRGRR